MTSIKEALHNLFNTDMRCANCDSQVKVSLFRNLEDQLRKRDWILIDKKPYCPKCYTKVPMMGLRKALGAVTYEVLEELLNIKKDGYKIIAAEADNKRGILNIVVVGKDILYVPEGVMPRYIALDIYKEDQDGSKTRSE